MEGQGRWQGSRAGGPRSLPQCTGPATQRKSKSRGQRRREDVPQLSPISLAGSLRGSSRPLVTQPMADTVLTWGQAGGWRDTQQVTASPGEDTGPSSTENLGVESKGPVRLDKLILMANTEPSWQGEIVGQVGGLGVGEEESPPSTRNRRWSPKKEWVLGAGVGTGGRAGRPISLAGVRGLSPVSARSSFPPSLLRPVDDVCKENVKRQQ